MAIWHFARCPSQRFEANVYPNQAAPEGEEFGFGFLCGGGQTCFHRLRGKACIVCTTAPGGWDAGVVPGWQHLSHKGGHAMRRMLIVHDGEAQRHSALCQGHSESTPDVKYMNGECNGIWVLVIWPGFSCQSGMFPALVSEQLLD